MKRSLVEKNNETHSTTNRLEEMGLSADDITYAVDVAYQEYISSTPNDPPIYPGIKAYFGGTRALRERLCQKNWIKDDTHNHATIYNPTTKVRIAVALGDQNTGKENAIPQTKNHKGSRTKILLKNNGQLYFSFFDNNITKNNFWVLLINFDNGKIAYELSLASKCNVHNRIADWDERIIFPVQEFTNPIYTKEDNDNFVPLQEIEIIKR